jgi:8-oxo-dGTP diphosphatase
LNPALVPDFFWCDAMLPLIVTAALIVHEGLLLVTQRRADAPYPLLWEFPGGKLEPSEDPRDCIVREIREELAIEVEADAVYEVIYHRYPERPVLVLVYRCRWVAGTVEDREVAAHRWVTTAELMSLELLPADIPLAERLHRELSDADSSLLHVTRQS